MSITIIRFGWIFLSSDSAVLKKIYFGASEAAIFSKSILVFPSPRT